MTRRRLRVSRPSMFKRSSTENGNNTIAPPCTTAPPHNLNFRLCWTRSSAIAEGPRDALCQLKSCQLPCNSAETTCTTSPEQIEVMKLEGYSGPICNKHVHSTMTRSSRFHCLTGVIIAKFHYTGPTGPDQTNLTKSADFVGDRSAVTECSPRRSRMQTARQ